ncbi:MAG: 7-cyano-7-deazaguanine synthase QueC [Gammaproteobacteria bacterium]|nr:MAG: 7-cyano-7-deazaguanine synthase QueC [Gammaproteobacteria bacterium]
MKKAVVLLSGGLDSATCLAYAKNAGFDCCAMSFSYGQKHHAELNAAKKIAEFFNATHRIVALPSYQFEGSSLTSTHQAVPDFDPANKAIPSTYVPARNTIFLAHALGWAEMLGAKDIFIGVSSVDYSGYPDCRPEYIAAFEKVANLATKVGVEEGNIKIHAPLVYLSKAETIKLGLELGVNYTMTVSCYRADAEGHACGTCDSCTYRKKGFLELGVLDQTKYSG